LHAGAAITAPNAGAFLTGLATAVASVPAGISCPRRYHCPIVGCLLSCLRCASASKGRRWPAYGNSARANGVLGW